MYTFMGWKMNPRLIKFAVELQNCEHVPEKKKEVRFLNWGYKSFFKIEKAQKVPVYAEK